jgi:hypothetical protein
MAKGQISALRMRRGNGEKENGNDGEFFWIAALLQ